MAAMAYDGIGLKIEQVFSYLPDTGKVQAVAEGNHRHGQLQLPGFVRDFRARPAQQMGGYSACIKGLHLLQQLQFLATKIYGTLAEQNACNQAGFPQLFLSGKQHQL